MNQIGHNLKKGRRHGKGESIALAQQQQCDDKHALVSIEFGKEFERVASVSRRFQFRLQRVRGFFVDHWSGAMVVRRTA